MSLVFKLRASALVWHLAGYGIRSSLSLEKKIIAEISTISYEDKGIINHHNMSG
jgi:hypothetical protein